MLRVLLVLLGLVALAPRAEAVPLNPIRSGFTLAGAYLGGVAGGVVGMGVYGALDPYGHDNAAEYVVVGGLSGFNVGAVAGATTGHLLAKGRAGGKILFVGGVMAAGGVALALLAPPYYAESDLSTEAGAMLGGSALLGIVGIPITATAISAFLGGKRAVVLAPMGGHDRTGLVVAARF